MSDLADDSYVRKLSSFIRSNNERLSQSYVVRRRYPRSGGDPIKPAPWFATSQQPVVLSIDLDKLYLLLIRFEELSLNVGSLDIKPSTPFTRPLFNDLSNDRSDALSISSFRSSISAISKLSLPVSSLFYQQPTIQKELKFIFSSFTKLPSLSVHSHTPKPSQRENDPFCVPLDVYRSLENLELVDADPRKVIGWDRISQNARVLTMRRCAVEDITSVLVDAVIEDKVRREKLRITQTILEVEDVSATLETPEVDPLPSPEISGPASSLPSYAWSLLLTLSIPQTGLTFVPSLPDLPALTHLDLSSNLLISIPPTLSSLSSLLHLNLSDNMIESTLSASSSVGAITFLDISKNRLESCVGLDKLLALEKVDLRDNNIEEADEISRLSAIPTIKAIFAEGNPLEDDWRIRCFNKFHSDGFEIMLDGRGPSLLERRHLTASSNDVQNIAQHHDVTTESPEPVTVVPSNPPSGGPSPKLSPHLPPSPAPRTKPKKRVRRVVELGADASESTGVTSLVSDGTHRRQQNLSEATNDGSIHPTIPTELSSFTGVAERLLDNSSNALMRGHTRRATDIGPPSPSMQQQNSHLGTHTHSRRNHRVSASVHDLFPVLSPGTPEEMSTTGDFRARMEALKNETGDDWLRVLAQREAVRPP